MAEQRTSRIWGFVAFAAVGSAVLSVMGSTQVQGVSRACCFDNADCVFLNRSTCEGQGGTPQNIGTNCSTVECPLLCGASFPECNGECPPQSNTTCVEAQNHGARLQGGPAFNGALCECVPEIPQGGSCEEQPEACAGGLPCVDGRCCKTLCDLLERCDVPGSEGVCTSIAAPAPALSQIGVIALVAILIAVGSLRFVRRRRLD